MANSIRVKKPYDECVDEIINKGLKRMRSYSKIGYLTRLNRPAQMFRYEVINHNDVVFVPNPKRRIRKNNKRSGKNYSIYDLE